MATGDPHNFGYGGCWCGQDHSEQVYQSAYWSGYRNARADHDDLPWVSNMPFTERRAWFVYEAARLAAAAAMAPIVPEPWGYRDDAFRKQFVEVIDRQSGPERNMSPEELHEDWVKAYEAMGWKYGETRDKDAKTHPDMVPYAELGQLERDKDAVFVALCEIARQWVYEMKPDGE